MEPTDFRSSATGASAMKLTALPLGRLIRHSANARDRRECGKDEVTDLASSIREHGLLQPLVITPDGEDYTILAGHRRHAALIRLGIDTAPCVVVEGDERR